MEKPISLKMTELKTNVLCCIQDSELSPLFMLPVIKEIYELIYHSAEMQYQNEKVSYEQFLQEEKKKEMKQE